MLRRFCAAALFICFVHPGGSKPQPYCVKQRLIICRYRESLPQWGKVSAKPTDEVFYILTEYYAAFM